MEFIKKIKQAEILNIARLLEPASGQIFSSMLAGNDLFTLELYSMSIGESISGHNLLETTMYFVTDGILEVNASQVQEGGCIIIEQSLCSELRAVRDCQFLVYTFLNRGESNLTLKHLCSGEVLRMEDQIDLRDNSVSSKAIVQKPQLTLTLFSMDTNEGLNTHSAPGDAMVIPLCGSNHVEIEDKPYDIEKGDFIILPAGIPHSLKASEPFKMLLTVVKA